MKKEQLLIERLKQYANTDMYPLHMPGHKRNDSDISFPDPFSIDITEIEGFDNLHHAEGILKDSMSWAAEVYGSDQTYYLVNGSSCGIMSAVCACVRPGGKILVSRNCHKSVYFGIILNGLKKVDVYPQIIERMGICGSVLPEDVEKILEREPDIEAVLIVSPTYDGVVSDIRKIAEIVHKKRIPLIVDEAHGAHFPFYHKEDPDFPASALSCGADLVIQSLHKTLPSMTQTSVLHAKKGVVNFARLERYLQMFQSSSPSYVLMASIEQCIFQMCESGGERYQQLHGYLKELRGAWKALKYSSILDKSVCDSEQLYDLDESKLVISVKDCCYRTEMNERVQADGIWLANLLRTRYHLEIEMAGADYVLVILTCFDTRDGINRLKNALLEIDGMLERSFSPICDQRWIWESNKKVLELSEAVDAECEAIPIEAAAGKISGEFVYLYPPGIPIVLPGEQISEQSVKKILEYRTKGFSVQGMQDEAAEKIRVTKQ